MNRQNLPIFKLVKFDKKKHFPKTIEEKLSDDFFILLTTFIGESHELRVNRLNLQKTLFLTKGLLYQEGIHFFNTGFYKFLYGPFQKKIFYSTQRLSTYSLLKKECETESDIRLSANGVNFLLFTLKKLKRDGALKKYKETVLDYLSEFSGNKAGKAIDLTHSIKVKVGGKIKALHEIEDNEDYYLEPLKKIKTKKTLSAPPEAIANLVNFRAYSI